MKKSDFLIGFLICITSLFSNLCEAQSFKLKLRGNDVNEFIAQTGLDSTFTDFKSCYDALQEAHQTMYKLGYFTSSIDSLTWTDSNANAFVSVGKVFVWAHLKNQNIPVSFLNQLRFDEKQFFGKKVVLKQLIPLYEKVLRHFEDNGYPFASLKLDSIRLHDHELDAQLRLDKGPLIKIDSIIINEDAKISRAFILRYLDLTDGMLYNESKIKAISTRIQELPFLAEMYPWRMSFTILKSNLNLYLKSKSANRADVLIGLLPNNAETQGKFLLTGDIKLGFNNALGQGETFLLNWQNLQYQSPRYNIDASYPFLLKTPFGVQGKFDYYKKDSTFKTVAGELGVVYQFNANDRMKLYYELSSNRLGFVNVATLVSTKRLPDNADVAYKTFGIEAGMNRVDYKLNPRKGFKLNGKMGVAIRQMIKNSTVEETMDVARNETFSYLYDSVKLHTYKYNMVADAQYYHPLGKRMVLATIYHGGLAFSSNELYRNELFQIGGYRLMRGFDEGSLYVNQYHVLTIEPRFLLGQNSYFFAFADGGFVQSKFSTTFIKDFLYSGGLGMTFETKGGLFNLSYAVGAREQQGFQFKNSKIHFGYINIF